MWNVWLLSLVSLLTDVSSEMAYPLLPLFLATLPGVSVGRLGLIVGVIEGLAESSASLLKVVSGRRADRTGRRKPLAILGYGGSALGKVLFVMAGAWPVVLLGRLVDRFGKGIRTAPRDALLADAAPTDRRGSVFGLHRFMDTLGALLGVLLAYLLLPSGTDTPRLRFNTIFLLSLIPALLGVLLLFAVRERSRETQPRRPGLTVAGLRTAWRDLDPRLRRFLLVALLFTLGNSSNQFLLLRAASLGFTPRSVLLLYAVYNVSYAVLAWPAGALSDRIGRRTLLVAGYAVYGVVYVGFGAASSATIWPLFAAYGAYIALTEGVEKALVTDLAPEAMRATLIGLHATIVGIGLLPASLLAGLLWQWNTQLPFVLGGVTGLVAALGMAVVLREDKR